MSKKGLQRKISQNGGMVISEATHRLDDLLPAAYDLLEENAIQDKGLRRKIAKAIGYRGDFGSAQTASYYDELSIQDEELATFLWNEDVFNFFNALAPKGYYFGTLDGDGACFGFFKEPVEAF